MNLGDVFLRLLADDKGFEKSVVASGEKAGDKAGQSLGARLKAALSPKNLAVAGFAAAAGGIGLFAAGLGQAVKDLMRIEQIGAQTDAVIRSTGGAAKVTRDDIDDMAQSIEKLSGIEAESVTEGQNLLLTFTNIRNEAGEGNDVFTRATEAMVDYGVAMGTDAKGGAIQLGKALNDPIKGIAALGRAGVQFTEDQKEMIRGFVETGDLLSAQKIILEELETQFGGSAEAFGETNAGKIAKFQNEVGDMFESIILGAVKVGEVLGADPFEGFAMNFGDQSDRIQTMADRMGETFDTLKNRIYDRMEETGESFTEAANHIDGEWANLSVELERETGRMMVGVGDAISAGIETEIKPEYKRMAAEGVSIMSAEARNFRDAAFQNQVAYAKGLLDGQDQPRVQMEALKQMQAEVLTSTAEQNRLLGQLNSKELAAGLADSRPAVRAQAEATRMAIVNQLAGLGIEAYQWGHNSALGLAGGMDRGYGVVVDSAGRLGGAIRGQIGINSEPEAHDSPLRGITKWGGNIVRTIADDILAHLGVGSAAAGALAGALVPGFGGAMPLAGGAMASGMGGGVTYQLVVNGVERTFNSRDDFMNALADLSRFGDGGLGG